MYKHKVHIAENLLLLRKHRGLLQNDIATFLHVNRSTYSYYELGSSEPPLQKLVLLAEFFGVSLDALVFSDPNDLLIHLPMPTPNIDSITKERPAE